jgi:NADPH:quinone reductase-like Zn-dependent oxidoreductase
MKAIRFHGFGGPEVLRYEDVEQPTPGPGQVRIRVAATSFNDIDAAIRAGELQDRTPVRLPHVPGVDVTGTVEDLGPGVDDVAVGDRVVGSLPVTAAGAAAEHVLAPAEVLTGAPTKASLVELAALPLAGLTAWQALFDHGRLAKGQTVVIHGAGGAVGSTAVQLARWAGAEVIGTGRSHSRSLVMELGADRFIALDEDRLEDAAGSGFQADVVFDLIGGEALAQSPALLKPGGALVSVVAWELPADRDDIRTVFFIQESSRAQLAELARLVDEGHLRPQVGGVYPLAQAAEAYGAKAAGGIPGRVVLRP